MSEQTMDRASVGYNERGYEDSPQGLMRERDDLRRALDEQSARHHEAYTERDEYAKDVMRKDEEIARLRAELERVGADRDRAERDLEVMKSGLWLYTERYLRDGTRVEYLRDHRDGDLFIFAGTVVTVVAHDMRDWVHVRYDHLTYALGAVPRMGTAPRDLLARVQPEAQAAAALAAELEEANNRAINARRAMDEANVACQEAHEKAWNANQRADRWQATVTDLIGQIATLKQAAHDEAGRARSQIDQLNRELVSMTERIREQARCSAVIVEHNAEDAAKIAKAVRAASISNLTTPMGTR